MFSPFTIAINSVALSRNEARMRFMTNSAASAVTAPPDAEESAMTDRDRGEEVKFCTTLSGQCNMEYGEDIVGCAQAATQRQGLAIGTSTSDIEATSSSIDSKTLMSPRAFFHLCGASIDDVKMSAAMQSVGTYLKLKRSRWYCS
jgi:hypothetical protein